MRGYKVLSREFLMFPCTVAMCLREFNGVYPVFKNQDSKKALLSAPVSFVDISGPLGGSADQVSIVRSNVTLCVGLRLRGIRC